MKTLTVSFLLCLFLGTSIEAIDSPLILWAREYSFHYFYNVCQTADNGFIVAGRYGVGPDMCVFKFDPSGYLQWSGGMTEYQYYENGRWVLETDDGGYLVTGFTRSSSTVPFRLFLAKFDVNGNELWTRTYLGSDGSAAGYCLLQLPDGGFLATGKVNSSSIYFTGLAWILRTDSEGDTLWSDIWGAGTVNYARRAIIVGDDIKILAYGRVHPDSSRATYILTYDMTGNLSGQVKVADLESDAGIDMCYDPSDGCFDIITDYQPVLAHVNEQGQVLWTGYIPGYGFPYGTSIDRTMDGGTVICGYNEPNPDYPWEEYAGIVGRFDSGGTAVWGNFITDWGCHELHSILQLQEGGYIVVGYGWEDDPQGLLIRYAPETGIEEVEPSPTSILLHAPSPNPSNGAFSISFDLPTDGQVALSVYDLSGRQVADLYQGMETAGDHTVGWDAEDLPSGCYIVILGTDQGMDSRTCVLLR